MKPLVVYRYVSILLFILSLSFLLPAAYSFYVKDGLFMDYLYPVILSSAFLLISLQIKSKELNIKEAILTVVLVWFLFPALSAFFYMESGAIPHFADAYFESASGFTTTGSSILTNVESLPKSVLLWRSTTNWIGGIGFVVFALSILPAFGTGGAQLMRFEASKAVEEKVLPRIKEVARAIFAVYLSLTILEIVLLQASGLNLYDAVNHTFATLSTGGFSTRNASVGAFHSFAVEMVIAIFMILGSTNLSLYYRAFKARSIRKFFSYYEVKSYLWIVAISTVFMVFILLADNIYHNPITAFRYGFFQVTNALSTTGFSSTNYTHWSPALLAIFMILPLIGGSAGSTAGGIKQFRFLVMLKTAYRELRKTTHPRLVYEVSLGNRVLEVSVLNAIWAFISIYFMTAIACGLIISIFGYDLVTSFSASIACITNFGPGLARVGPAGNFAFFPSFIKLLLSVETILGRLEIFPIFTLLLPSFWRE